MSQNQQQFANKNYLNYIQSLRAVAVLFVFFFHSNLNLFSKGYLGVDIFFVISGYVITKQLEEKFFINNKLEIKKFFIRRILKIIPVYFFIITVFFFSFLFFGPLTEFYFFKVKLKFIYLFASNFYYLNYNKNYFDNIFSDPLNHTWSLGVEMQFYLVFPFFFYLLRNNLKPKKIIKILLCTITLSIALIIYLSKDYNRIFYSTQYRAWEFLQGAFVYFAGIENAKDNNNQKKFINEEKKSWLIFLLMLLVIFFPNKNNLIINQFLIVILTSLFIFFKNSRTSFFFSNRFLVYLGNISYSFYLWHLPVIYFVNIYYKSEKTLIASIVITFILGNFSYTLIENRFKRFKNEKSPKKNNFLKFFFICLIIIIPSFYFFYKLNRDNLRNFVLKNNYLEKKFLLTKRLNYNEIKINNNEVYNFCTENSKIYTINHYGLKNECFEFFDNKNLVYIEGNSHTAIFIPLIRTSLKKSIYYRNNTSINDNNSYTFYEVNNQFKYFKDIYYVRSINNLSELNVFKNNLINFDKKINFFIIGPVPNFYDKNIKPTQCLIHNIDCVFNLNDDYNNRELDNLFKKLSNLNNEFKENKIIIYNPYKTICPSNNCFIYKTNSNFLTYRDGNHLTIEGSFLLKKDFELLLKKNIF